MWALAVDGKYKTKTEREVLLRLKGEKVNGTVYSF